MPFGFDFGLGGSSGSTRNSPWAPQGDQLQNLFSQAGEYFNNTNPQSLTPGFNQNQVQGQQGALNFAQGGAQQLGNNAQTAFNLGLNAPDVNNNPWFNSALDAAIRPVTQNYQENVLPGIGHSATAAGQPGSSRQGVAEGIAARAYLDQIGGMSAGMASDAYGQGLNAMIGTLGQSGNVANLGLLPSSIQQDVGGQQRDLTQQQANAPYELLRQYMSLLGPAIAGTTRTSEQSWDLGGNMSG